MPTPIIHSYRQEDAVGDRQHLFRLHFVLVAIHGKPPVVAVRNRQLAGDAVSFSCRQ
jgi:hypothetical protein